MSCTFKQSNILNGLNFCPSQPHFHSKIMYCFLGLLLLSVDGYCHPSSTHMQDLQEVTQDLHYENFRSERLKRGGRLSSHGYILPLSPAYVLLCLPFSTSSLNLHEKNQGFVSVAADYLNSPNLATLSRCTEIAHFYIAISHLC